VSEHRTFGSLTLPNHSGHGRVDDTIDEGVDGSSSGIELPNLRQDSGPKILFQILRFVATKAGRSRKLPGFAANQAFGIGSQNGVRCDMFAHQSF
jgi:hypothetical protein